MSLACRSSAPPRYPQHSPDPPALQEQIRPGRKRRHHLRSKVQPQCRLREMGRRRQRIPEIQQSSCRFSFIQPRDSPPSSNSLRNSSVSSGHSPRPQISHRLRLLKTPRRKRKELQSPGEAQKVLLPVRRLARSQEMQAKGLRSELLEAQWLEFTNDDRRRNKPKRKNKSNKQPNNSRAPTLCAVPLPPVWNRRVTQLSDLP
jgi:hypothetical protein